MKKLFIAAISLMIVCCMASVSMASSDAGASLGYQAGGNFDASGAGGTDGRIFRAKAYDEVNYENTWSSYAGETQVENAFAATGKKVQSRGLVNARGEGAQATLNTYGFVGQETDAHAGTLVEDGDGFAWSSGLASEGSSAGYSQHTDSDAPPSWTDKIHMNHKGDAQSYGFSSVNTRSETAGNTASSSLCSTTGSHSQFGNAAENPQQVTAYRNNGYLAADAQNSGDGQVVGDTHVVRGDGEAWGGGQASYAYNTHVGEESQGSGSFGAHSSMNYGFAATKSESEVTKHDNGDTSAQSFQRSWASSSQVKDTSVHGGVYISNNEPDVN